MGKNYCAVKDCHNVSGRIGRFGKPVKLHELPKKQHLRTAWLRAISRKHFNPKRTQVCSDHFPEGNGRTWNNQVPTLFLPHKTVKSVKVRLSTNSNKMNIESPAQAVDVNDHNYSVHQIVKGPSPQHRNLDIDPTDSKVSKDIVPSSLDNFSNCELPEITIDDIKDNNDKMLFYTGLPDFGTYKALFESLIQQGADKLVLDSSAMKTETDGKKGEPRGSLELRMNFLWFSCD